MEAVRFVLSKVAVRFFTSAVLIGSGVVMEKDCTGGGAANAVGPSIRHVIKTHTFNLIVAVLYELVQIQSSRVRGIINLSSRLSIASFAASRTRLLSSSDSNQAHKSLCQASLFSRSG